MTEGVAAIDLSAVNRPVLLVTSVNDDVVDPASSDVIAAALSCHVQRLRLRSAKFVSAKFVSAKFVSAKFVSDSTGSRPMRDR